MRRIKVLSEGVEANFDNGTIGYRQHAAWKQGGSWWSGKRWQTASGWESWEEVKKLDWPVNHPRQILPSLTEEEKDLWAEFAFSLLQSHEVLSVGELAGILPGWDDIYTFSPGRTPTPGSPRIWGTHPGTLATARARAMAGMMLRRLAAQKRAFKFSGEEWYGLGQP